MNAEIPNSVEEGVERLYAAAQSGDAQALHVLGLACFQGQGVERDLAVSRELQLAAAARGLPDAQFELSLLLEQGIGGRRDRRGAERWEAKAAEAGHARACLNRGARLANRKQPDWKAVAQWYARAAAAGSAEAARRLRQMHRVPGNPARGTAKPARKNQDARYSTLLVNKARPSTLTKDIP